MRKMLNDAKWTLGLSGVLMIVVGVLLFLHPVASAWAYAMIVGWILVAAAVAEIVGFCFNTQKFYAGWLLVSAIVNALLGLMLISRPGLSYDLLVTIFGLWAVVNGASDFANSFALKAIHYGDWGWLLVGAVVEIIAGLLVIFNPLSGFLAATTVIAVGFVWRGIVNLVNACKVQAGLNKLNRFQRALAELTGSND